MAKGSALTGIDTRTTAPEPMNPGIEGRMAEVISLPLPPVAKYWAFISYSHHDRKSGEWLIRALETYRIPKPLIGKAISDGFIPKRLTPVFRDRDELPGAADLGEKIREAINQSRVLIVICSPNAANSEWVNKEVVSFKSSGRGSRVLTLIVDGEPNAADADRECFPPAVRYRVNESGVITGEAAEPLAADARDQGDGRRNALLKLVAGILEIPYDDLRQRERERVRRARRITTAITSSVIAVLGVFLCIAVWQGWLAKKETISALIQSSEARFTASEDWDALTASLRAAQKFYSLPLVEYFDPDIRSQISQSLQQALYGIKEYKRLKNEISGDVSFGDSSVGQIDWSPDGKSLAFLRGRGRVTLWRPDSNSLGSTDPNKVDAENDGEIRSVSWRPPNGETLATLSENGRIKYFDPQGHPQGNQLLPSFRTISGAYGISWRPDGQELALASLEKGVVVYKPDDGTRIDNPRPHLDEQVWNVSWSPEGKHTLAAGGFKDIVMWENPDGTSKSCDVGAWIWSMSWSPDGKFLAVGLGDDTVRLLSQAQDCEAGPQLIGHTEPVSGVNWSNDWRLATASEGDRTVRLWDKEGTLLETLHALTVSGGVQWRPDGQVLATVDQYGLVRLWKDNPLLKTFTVHKHAAVKDAALSPDGYTLAFASGNRINLWRQDRDHGWLSEPVSLPSPPTLEGRNADVQSVSWSPDGQLLASTSYDAVTIWNRDGTLTQTFRDKDVGEYIYTVSWHPNGEAVAIGDGKGNITLWNSNNGSILGQTTCGDWAQTIAWNSAHDRLLAVGCHHKAGAYLLEWEPDKKELHKKQLLAGVDVLGVSWSHDGEILATSGNNRINLWGRDGAHIGAVDTGDEVGRVAWSPDGQILAVASGNVVKLFKVVKLSKQDELPITILPITVLKGRAGVVTSVTWNKETPLVSASDDGTVKLWQIDEGFAGNLLDKLVERSCDWLDSYLENNSWVSKEDSDLQDLCSRARTAAPPSGMRTPAESRRR